MKVMRSVRGRITTKLIYLTLSFSPALPAFRAQRFPTRECGKWLDFAAHDTAPHDRDTVHKWKLVHSKLGEIAVPLHASLVMVLLPLAISILSSVPNGVGMPAVLSTSTRPHLRRLTRTISASRPAKPLPHVEQALRRALCCALRGLRGRPGVFVPLPSPPQLREWGLGWDMVDTPQSEQGDGEQRVAEGSRG